MSSAEKVEEFRKGFQQGQEFADQLEGRKSPRLSALRGLSGQRQEVPGMLRDRTRARQFTGSGDLSETEYIYPSSHRPPLGPITSDDGVMQVYVPSEWENSLPSLSMGRIVDPILDEIKYSPEANGKFDEVTEFTHAEMKRNSQSRAAGILAEANRKRLKPWALAGWANLVWPKHAWDHKPTLLGHVTESRKALPPFSGTPAFWFRDGGDQYGYEIWSNIHYGYVGRKVGIGPRTLLAGAGAAQLSTLYGERVPVEERKAAWGRAFWELQGPRGLDDPMDSSAIRLGMHLYEKHGDDLTLDHLREEVRNWPGLKAIRRPATVNRYIDSVPKK